MGTLQDVDKSTFLPYRAPQLGRLQKNSLFVAPKLLNIELGPVMMFLEKGGPRLSRSCQQVHAVLSQKSIGKLDACHSLSQ